MYLSSPRFAVVAPSLALTFTVSAFAHPGHDDGHEVVWEASHWLAHPAASVLCLAVLGLALFGGFRLARRTLRSRPVRRDS
jgi:hypothetical protein